MRARRWVPSGVLGLLAVAFLVASSESRSGEGQPIMRDLELEALQEAVRWPNAEVPTTVALGGRFIASDRDQEAYTYFQGRARSQPDRPLFLALEGFFPAPRALP